MGLETGTYIDDLVVTNPTPTDNKSQGDDHLRFIKSTIKNTFPNITGAVTPTQTELNYVDGVTSSIQDQFDAITTLADGKLYMGNGSNVATEVTVSGDITIANDGTAAISSGVIVNADINASAAIDLSKLASGTANYAIIANGSGVPTYTQYKKELSAVSYSAAGAVYTFAHGLSAIPTMVMVKLTCTDAGGDANWSQNDVLVPHSYDAGNGKSGYTIGLDSTNVKVYVMTNGLGITNKTTFADAKATPGSWDMSVSVIV